VSVAKLLLIASLLLCSSNAGAQSVDPEPVAVVELGAATAVNLNNSTSSFGPSAAVEITPVENWLELEVGVTPLFRRHSTEWNTDLLFKKPWALSERVEFMLGAGPEWVYARQNGVATNSVSFEVAADFMFWSSKKRRFGWYLEPAYEYNFARGHEQSLGVSGGLLIAF